MLSSKLQNKVYGAVHDTNDFRYIGFCKKVQSSQIQKVDVFIDGKKVDTLSCDKTIQKIYDIYDKKACAFEYNLPKEYIGKQHLIEFSSDSGELENSKFITIKKDNINYNRYMLLNSLLFIDDNIKNIYKKNSIGFLATEENINDKNFIAYIKELYIKFPQVTFKVFYFKENLTPYKHIFSNESDRFTYISPSNIKDIINEIEIYIGNTKNKGISKILSHFISIHCRQIVYIYKNNIIDKNALVSDSDNASSYNFDIVKKYIDTYPYTKEDLEKANGSFVRLDWDYAFSNIMKIEHKLEDNSNLYQLTYFDIIKYSLKYPDYKQYVFDILQIHRKNVISSKK